MALTEARVSDISLQKRRSTTRCSVVDLLGLFNLKMDGDITAAQPVGETGGIINPA